MGDKCGPGGGSTTVVEEATYVAAGGTTGEPAPAGLCYPKPGWVSALGGVPSGVAGGTETPVVPAPKADGSPGDPIAPGAQVVNFYDAAGVYVNSVCIPQKPVVNDCCVVVEGIHLARDVRPSMMTDRHPSTVVGFTPASVAGDEYEWFEWTVPTDPGCEVEVLLVASLQEIMDRGGKAQFNDVVVKVDGAPQSAVIHRGFYFEGSEHDAPNDATTGGLTGDVDEFHYAITATFNAPAGSTITLCSILAAYPPTTIPLETDMQMSQGQATLHFHTVCDH